MEQKTMNAYCPISKTKCRKDCMLFDGSFGTHCDLNQMDAGLNISSELDAVSTGLFNILSTLDDIKKILSKQN